MIRKFIMIIIFTLLILGVGGLLLLKQKSRDLILDGPGMVYEDHFDFSQTYLSRVYYYKGGSSLGDSSSVELVFSETEDGRPEAIVRYYDQPSHDQKAVEKEVRLNSNVVTGVQDLIDQYGMREWKDLPETDLIALDAPGMWFTYEYSDGTTYELGSDLEMPDGAYEAIQKIRSYVLTCAGIREDNP